jgi:serine/threonine protein phosphatase PrpC
MTGSGNMRYLTKTSRGFSHIRENTVCQDFSASYHDENMTILTCCDGHGGKLYFRSDRGSKFASDAIIECIKAIDVNKINLLKQKEFQDKLKLQILCAWNRLVEDDISKHPFKDEELEQFNEDKLFIIKNRPEVAYGTTINAVAYIDKYFLCIRIGDGGVVLFKDNKFALAFEDDDESVANITNSICEERAFDHFQIALINKREVDGVLICTDGLLVPYQSYCNFVKYFVLPSKRKMYKQNGQHLIELLIERIAKKIGVGDDVSVGIILK